MNLRPFEIVLIGFFTLCAIVALIYVSVRDPDQRVEEKKFGDSVSIWGPFDSEIFNKILVDFTRVDKSFSAVSYTEIDESSFSTELLSAIAEGRGPDLIIMPHSLLVSYRGKLKSISYEDFPQRSFRDAYIDGSEIFMLRDGVYGIPFAVDPLVMYWNRDLFSSGGLANPPRTWETLVNETVPALTRSNEKLEITQSAISFGEYSNVQYAKHVLSMLFLQSGVSFVNETEYGYDIAFNRSQSEAALPPAHAVLAFYSQFVSPTSVTYTWNRALPLDRRQFLGGKLAMFIAPGSEYRILTQENPNLNFDVTTVPQGNGATVFRTYGEFYAFAIPRASQNPVGAYNAAIAMGAPEMAQQIARAFSLAPVHRSLLQASSNDPYEKIIFSAALTARGWLDPSPGRSALVFKEMVEMVSSGRERVEGVIDDTGRKLELLFK